MLMVTASRSGEEKLRWSRTRGSPGTQAQILVYQASLDKISFAQALVECLESRGDRPSVQVFQHSYGAGEFMFSSTEQPQSIAACDTRGRGYLGLSAVAIVGHIPAHTQCGNGFIFRQATLRSCGRRHPFASEQQQRRISETAWGEDDNAPALERMGSGGGVSQNNAFRRPSWQTGPGQTVQHDGTLQESWLPPSTNPVSALTDCARFRHFSGGIPNIAITTKGLVARSWWHQRIRPIVAAGNGARRSGPTTTG